MSVPPDTYSWLRSLSPPLERYAATLSRNGLETTFSLGLIDDVEVLTNIGIWQEEALAIMGSLNGPRRLVSEWDPFIGRIPVERVSLAEYLLMTPVPHLASHARILKAQGFDHIACLKSIQKQDLDLMPSIPVGHQLAILHISVSASSECFSVLPSIEVPLRIWLSHLAPPMHIYENTLSLLTTRRELSVMDLLHVTWDRIASLPMPIGHKRVLWHYIVKERLYWVECLI